MHSTGHLVVFLLLPWTSPAFQELHWLAKFLSKCWLSPYKPVRTKVSKGTPSPAWPCCATQVSRKEPSAPCRSKADEQHRGERDTGQSRVVKFSFHGGSRDSAFLLFEEVYEVRAAQVSFSTHVLARCMRRYLQRPYDFNFHCWNWFDSLLHCRILTYHVRLLYVCRIFNQFESIFIVFLVHVSCLGFCL